MNFVHVHGANSIASQKEKNQLKKEKWAQPDALFAKLTGTLAFASDLNQIWLNKKVSEPSRIWTGDLRHVKATS